MPIMKDLKTGEEKEISLEEFLELTRGEELCVKQVVRNEDGSEETLAVYGDEADAGEIHYLNIFAQMSTVFAASGIMAKRVKEMDENTTQFFRMDNQEQECKILVDDTQSPLMHIVQFTKQDVYVRRYVRDEQRSTMGSPLCESRIPFVNGMISVGIKEIQDDHLLYFAFGVFEIVRQLKENGLFFQLQKMKNRGCGITATGEDVLSLEIVQGYERPDLPCMLFGGMFAESADEAIMMRPYADEIFMNNSNAEFERPNEDETHEIVSLEERLYDFLMSQNEPQSIGEINGEKEFQEVPRRVLVQSLQSLVEEGVAFRSLREGKAYYFKESTGQGKRHRYSKIL